MNPKKPGKGSEGPGMEKPYPMPIVRPGKPGTVKNPPITMLPVPGKSPMKPGNKENMERMPRIEAIRQRRNG